MSSKKQKLNRMARKVVDGEVTVNQARAVLGKKPLPDRARPGVQKSARPGVTESRSRGEAEVNAAHQALYARQVLKGAGSAAVRPDAYWSGADLALLQKSQDDADPLARENARKALVAKGLMV